MRLILVVFLIVMGWGCDRRHEGVDWGDSSRKVLSRLGEPQMEERHGKVVELVYSGTYMEFTSEVRLSFMDDKLYRILHILQAEEVGNEMERSVEVVQSFLGGAFGDEVCEEQFKEDESGPGVRDRWCTWERPEKKETYRQHYRMVGERVAEHWVEIFYADRELQEEMERRRRIEVW